MKLLIIRHAKAEDRAEYATTNQSDRFRPLLPKGIAKFERVAACLVKKFPKIDKVFSSEFVRSVETASILTRVASSSLEIISHLNPGREVDFLNYYRNQKRHWNDGSVLAFVGHNPDISYFINEICQLRDEDAVRMKKSGVCYLNEKAGEHELKWIKKPSQLFSS